MEILHSFFSCKFIGLIIFRLHGVCVYIYIYERIASQYRLITDGHVVGVYST